MKVNWPKSLFISGFIVTICFMLVIGYESFDLAIKPLVEKNGEPIIVIVPENSSASTLVKTLSDKHLIQSTRFFLLLIRLQGLSYRLKAGVYQVKAGESAQQLLSKIVAGDVLLQLFRIVEGNTLNQVQNNLEKAPFLKYNSNDFQAINSTHPNAEGLLLADTYYYNSGSRAKQLLHLANQKLAEFLTYSWQHRNPDLPYKSAYELLIAASIIEKESAIPNERKIISGIIVNRLKKRMPLQMDPTVIYALGLRYQGKLSHNDMSVDSPYNTYRYRGLPPTPIAMVGKEAIEAAAHPLMSDYLYFVAKGDGSHHFSATYNEQQQAITQYQKKEGS